LDDALNWIGKFLLLLLPRKSGHAEDIVLKRKLVQ